MADDRPTQKQISGQYRGNLDYFRKPHYLRKLRWWCFAIAVAGSIAGVVTVHIWGRQKVFSTGPISENHARFANDCRVCHLDADSDLSRLLRVKNTTPSDGMDAKNNTSLSLMDQACTQCHPTMGLHLPQATGLALQKVSSELGVVHATACASCHREHVSREGMAPPDRQTCVACHGNADELKRTRSSIKLDHAPVAATVENRSLGDGIVGFIAPARPAGSLPAFASYAEGHPPFGYEQPGVRDPAELKFNHARHLRGDLPSVKNRKLDCADCHQPGAGGVFYQPVKYEKHCAECHSLQIQPSLPKLHVPHGDPEKVRYFLASLKLSFEYAVRAEGVGDPVEISKRVESEVQTLRRRGLNTLTDLEDRVFFQGDPKDDKDGRLMRAGNPKFLTECAKCHTVDPGSAEHAPKVHPPHMAERWVQRGPFTHLPHEHMACADCQAAASKSKLTSDILLPSQTLCAECHRPLVQKADQPWDALKSSAGPAAQIGALAAAQRSAGGVKWDCQGCHVFHAPPDASQAVRPAEGKQAQLR